ncbi:MAG: hypothetical protein ABSB95_10660 [Dissulfurispiraceae bacterium]|jgi:protein TonB
MNRDLSLPRNADIDNPWRRLPWTLPTALLIWAVALVGFAYFMENPTHPQSEMLPIEAQLIEQPVPAATQKRPAAVQRPKPMPPVKPKQSAVSPRTEQNPAEVKTNTAVALPAAAAPAGAQATATGNISANSTAQAGPYVGKGPSHGDMYATSGARAIVRPMPQIPDDLREGAFNFTALARFHIAADGSVKVELARPTPNPRLNRILLDSLMKWRFIPAIKNGKPVASTEEIKVNIDVK